MFTSCNCVTRVLKWYGKQNVHGVHFVYVDDGDPVERAEQCRQTRCADDLAVCACVCRGWQWHYGHPIMPESEMRPGKKRSKKTYLDSF